LLLEGRCAVSKVPADRFATNRFGHPRRSERGRSYSWSAGIIDDFWGFDPSVFGISPREAEQMDPQQRILLQLTWEALEDAGIRPSTLAGTDVGVFIGASQTDYAHQFFADYAIADSHFATGTSLAVLANRISYAYDLHGPSVTVDTACSSSLVALNHAVEALNSGRVDTAIVGGINVIASPASFIAFSQASMLSERGLCQAFSANADGFVRAEGGAVLVLRKSTYAQTSRNPVHGLIVATEVNSDGRTNGISLPSGEAQEALLERVYSRSGIDPNRLAFVEAHGTGTPAGDPIEAGALGRGIGRRRSNPLPIGSIKTNIGHLEPASGMAGLLKAMLSLNHGILPPSLHCAELNPNIDFDRLNLKVCDRSLLLPHASQSYAGVNSFGFGGTNAHAIVAPGRKAAAPAAGRSDTTSSGLFALSAASKAALGELALEYAMRVENMSDDETDTLARAVVHRRDHLTHRMVIASSRSREVVNALGAFTAGNEESNLLVGEAQGTDNPVAFVYSGNGSQWAGMGLQAYRNNAHFRAHFDHIDNYFKQIAGWSLKDTLFSETLADRLPLTSVVQPLIFAIQCATTAALRARGLHPAMVIGHSVGEVAAAEAAGILDLRTAVKVIYSRSTNQELIRGAGRMAAVLAPEEKATQLAAEIGGVEIAAINSPRAVTIAGPAESIAAFRKLAKRDGIAVVELDLDYPFHTTLMNPIEKGLITDLKNINPRDADIPFVSTVTGDCLVGLRLNGEYWWRNVREPVQFAGAIRIAAKLGARYFVEIGPRATLLKHMADNLTGEVDSFGTAAVLDRNDGNVDPFDKAVAKALVAGAQIDLATAFGPDPGPEISLPYYPWQQKPFRFQPTPEAVGSDYEQHPFAGARYNKDSLVWRANVDTAIFTELADHKVGEQIIFPGTGFLEIALAVGKQWLQSDNIIVADFEILKPLDLTNGETREIMTRVSPGSNTIEIFSRLRLSNATWLLNCRGKLLHGTGVESARCPAVPSTGRVVEGREIYHLADSNGLHYGPAFRLVDNVVVHSDNLISVELAPVSEPARFMLDPMRLDACSHGIFTTFPGLHTQERGVTYIPVRLDESVLYAAGGMPTRCLIQIVSKTERSTVGNYYIYGAEGELIAILRGVQCQAVPVKRLRSLSQIALIELPQLIDGTISGNTGIPATAKDLMAAASRSDIVPVEAPRLGDQALLVEGWATAAAHEIVFGLSDGIVVDVNALVENGSLPEELRPWLVNLLLHLEAAGLAKQERGSWVVFRDESLPSSTSVIKALAGEGHSLAAQLLLAGTLSGFAEDVAANRAVAADPASILSKTTLDFYDSTHRATHVASDLLAKLVTGIERRWPKDRALRVLQIGVGSLAQSIVSHFGNATTVTAYEPDQRRYEQAERRSLANQGVTLISGEHASKLGTYDLILSATGLHRLPHDGGLARLNELLAPNGALIAIELQPSLFNDLVFGMQPGWFAPGSSEYPVGALQPAEYWRSALDNAGLADVTTSLISCDQEVASLLIAKAGPIKYAAEHAGNGAAAEKPERTLFFASEAKSPLAAKLAELARGSHSGTVTAGALSNFPALPPDTVVMADVSQDDPIDPVRVLTQRCMDIKSCAEKIGDAKATLWLIFSGALGVGSTLVRPIETGAWAFSRTLANEFPNLDIRRIDISPSLAKDMAAAKIDQIIGSGTPETEIHVDAGAVRAVRVQSLTRSVEQASAPPAPAARLYRRIRDVNRLAWQPSERKRPDAGEVEIAVEATGLNFRDLMWTLSLLPDDMLEDGYTGPTLGLECAGRVIQVGAGVKNLNVGDRVAAFAAQAFATHVTVPAAQAAKLPDNLTCEDAATIPVAFVTAYYSLVTLAQLRRNEWVLVHGGAGGVGMSAIQIAHARGARVIASAGSRGKRDLLKALGVEFVLDSRSTNFVDDVRAITGSGVHVVLNSLAGEAMERSIACLRPFGRFVELGKRDYVTNTHVGLRPFRKNLSYFGVDLDQLIVGKRTLGEKVYRQMMRQFERGVYKPLPYSVFEASEVAEAFQLMQHSGHIGKIVVRPPQAGAVRAASKPHSFNADGTHLITGAFGGFGIETAKWLADRGVRFLVLVGRQGAATPEAKDLVRSLTARGVKVLAEPCDISDRKSVEKLFDKIHTTMPPLVGVMHAAMVLDDAVIANLDAERFATVLGPKVEGANHLDLATRGLPLEYFVMFSSVTTLMGNPGQGNYVAANAYMEGLARRRRQEGLPALAIGWGPIIDVGVVARSQKLKSNLQKLTGVSGLKAREGLDLMEEALARPSDVPELAVMTISPNEGAFGGGRLPILQSPTYAQLVSQSAGGAEGEGEKVDLNALIQSEGIDVTRRKVIDVIVAQLARVLHSREEDISRTRPLAEIGLDSLMALELVMKLEEVFGIHVSLSGSAGGLTVSAVADEIIAHVDTNFGREEAAIAALAEQHAEKVEVSQVAALKELMTEEASNIKRLLS
jgi:acyl transferase domain-containing protein/NADPH:quinone reductase-like Zn-dependent oxidoreductase/acyl carrier protein/NADP-dependent 3-hydroxy acid dehydrogenase YdfG